MVDSDVEIVLRAIQASLTSGVDTFSEARLALHRIEKRLLPPLPEPYYQFTITAYANKQFECEIPAISDFSRPYIGSGSSVQESMVNAIASIGVKKNVG